MVTEKEVTHKAIELVYELLKNKKKMKEDIKKDGQDPEFFKSLEPLLKRNAERGTPFIEAI